MATQLLPDLNVALGYHQAGDFLRAEALYQEILKVDPAQADALHLLGVLAHQAGDQVLAQTYIRRALILSPTNAVYLSNLGAALQAAGQPEAALQNYQRALQLAPEYPEAHYNLGALHQAAGRFADAAECFRAAVRYKSDYFGAHWNLGNVLTAQGLAAEATLHFQRAIELDSTHANLHACLAGVLFGRGRLREAAASYRKAVQLRPDLCDAYNNLGVILKTLQNYDEAEACFRRAIFLKPDFVDPYWNLGNLLRDIGKLDESISSLHHALKLAPNHIEGLNNLGITLRNQGKLDEALTCYQRVLELFPKHASAYNNIGNVQFARHQFQEAISSYRRALEYRPNFAEAWNNLATVQRAQGDLDEATTGYRRAILLNPSYPEAWNNLGIVFKDRGQIADSIASFREALRLQPDLPDAHSNLLLSMNYDPNLDPAEMFAEHCRWGAQFGKAAERQCSYANRKDPERRLRIGYVSPDFRSHAMAYFLEPILSRHDSDQFDVVAYAEVAAPDAVTKRLQGLVGEWRNTCGQSDRQVAEQIRQDGIDILVDLAGHTALNRLRVFAWEPAPVQITGLGYGETTGLTSMGYRLTDAIADPLGETVYYTEELVRLPHGVYCYQPPADAPVIAELPALRNGFITFGSFNNLSKLSPPTFELWSQVLSSVPNSKLLLKDRSLRDVPTQELVRAHFARHGIAGERLELVGLVPSTAGHLELYGRVDIALDPLPYTGLTTTCEALWMGVPVVTQRGRSFVGRLSASLCTFAGLTELIAENPAEYLELATRLSADVNGLAARRTSWRERLGASPACDAGGYTRELETIYRTLWRRWCEQQ